MSDLIERLRNVRGSFVIPIEAPNVFGWADEAADELERLTAQRNKAIEAGANEVSYRVELEAENEHLRAALEEGLEVANDLINKTDIYLGINDAYDRHDKWEKQAAKALNGDSDG